MASSSALPASVPVGSASETVAILDEFAQAYLTHVGQPNYNPAFDLNHNGQIGQTDGRLPASKPEYSA